MTPDEVERYRHQLCGKSAAELIEASAECTAVRLQYIRRMCTRPLTAQEQMQMDNVEELQDLINEAKDALAFMREKLPHMIAPGRSVKR